jgi:hypothetical protein
MHMYISIFNVVKQSFLKMDILGSLCKKDKNMHRDKAYFSTKFCHFYIDHIKSQFLLKQLCRHVEHRYVHKKIVLNFLIFFKCIKNTF